ncbi:hypothetical protein ETAA8_10970 [Anatilimnocola aggregata]|uniref:Uncharacterized protein n=1 Tax=Anatilimnocola aggregata TaxID=2528021 RepID=A0A517Y727_9BACT|nr:hypothetical protein [Anatilimnocola aggregata]QDU26025.1 hypothetical protein ETAA8_10970 [Anatilimnocola aggregata]
MSSAPPATASAANIPAASVQQLQSSLAQGGAAAVLVQAAEQLRKEKRHHELFEALKMQLRLRLGLPLQSSEGSDGLSEPLRKELEDGLIAACREVGTLLIKEGKVREGYMYLRPVGELAEARALLEQVVPDEDNTEELIEVLLHEGVDIGRGFQLMIDQYGTCSSITQYEQSVARRPRHEQQPAARKLLQKVHSDLVGSVKHDIARQEGGTPPENTLLELIRDREWLFFENAYHIDTTHLAATVRNARVLTDPTDLRMALDLTEYGRRLSQQFQYQGDEPFADQYPSNALYFQSLLGENVDEAIAYFQQKSELLDPQYHGSVPIETYVELLARLNKPGQAIAAAIKLNPKTVAPIGMAPSLIELAIQAKQFDAVLSHCQEQGDILGYAACLAAKAK